MISYQLSAHEASKRGIFSLAGDILNKLLSDNSKLQKANSINIQGLTAYLGHNYYSLKKFNLHHVMQNKGIFQSQLSAFWSKKEKKGERGKKGRNTIDGKTLKFEMNIYCL